jgi:acyl carrier protein
MITSIFNPEPIVLMGEDTLELIQRIEEEFAVDLPDDELRSVAMVGDLYRAVLSKLETAPSFRPAISFYRLRRAIIKCLGRQRKFIRPTTKLAHLMPRPTRIAAWKSLAEVSALEFPKLRHPRWARDTFRGLGWAGAAAFFVGMVLWTHPVGFPWIPLAVATPIVGIFVTNLLYAVTPFLAYDLPMRTVGELSKILMGMNISEFGSESEGGRLLSKEDVWQRIVAIFVEQMGLSWEEITPEARIGEDLGMD